MSDGDDDDVHTSDARSSGRDYDADDARDDDKYVNDHYP